MATVQMSAECSITYAIMIDPVVAEDGRVYERNAIMKWFRQSNKSPFTNAVIGTKLIPLLELRNAIREAYPVPEPAMFQDEYHRAMEIYMTVDPFTLDSRLDEYIKLKIEIDEVAEYFPSREIRVLTLKNVQIAWRKIIMTRWNLLKANISWEAFFRAPFCARRDHVFYLVWYLMDNSKHISAQICAYYVLSNENAVIEFECAVNNFT